MVGLKGYVEETQRLGGDVSNPQQELEAAYVAQICLTWEALNWNYKNLKKLMSAKEHAEFGHYAHVAQQLQQFQVLLRRFIEIEPFEHGCRPEIYARMRISRPKLLQVPELRGSPKSRLFFVHKHCLHLSLLLSVYEKQKLISSNHSLIKIKMMASHGSFLCFL